MNDNCRTLLAWMVACAVVGDRERMWKLYDKYTKENRLHVPVEEILRAKREGIA